MSDATEAINNEELDKELAIALTDELAIVYLFPSSEEEVLDVHLSVGDSEGVGDQAEAGLALEDDLEVRFEAFKADRVPIYKQGVVFVAKKHEKVTQTKQVYKQTLPPPLKIICDLIGHRFETEFREAQWQYLESY